MANIKLRANVTEVRRCPFCKAHPYQDARYGRGMRVMNATQKSGTPWKCTVCGTKQS